MRKSDGREQLLSAGLKVLHARGFNASGVQDITAAAGVPKGSFYNHFDSKEAFGAEVLTRFWEEASRRGLPLLSDESRPPMERLRAYFSAKTQANIAARFELGCMIGNFAAEMAGQSRLVRDRLAVLLAGWTRAVASVVREAQEAGEIGRDIPAETLAAFLIDAWEGAVLRSKVDRDPEAFGRFERIIFERVLV